MKKSASSLCAAIVLASPFVVHAAGIDFKQMIKDSVKAGTQQPAAAPAADSGQPLPAPGQGGNYAVPKVLETMGVKIGDTPEQVDKVLTSQGYKKYDTTNHLLGMHLQGILWSTKYIKRSGKNSPYWNDPMVDVRYGPQSGKVLAIRRTEKFEVPVVGSEIKKALTEKYGTPTSGRYEDVNWVAYRPGFVYSIKGSDRDDCMARGNVNLNGSPDRNRLKDCGVAVGVRFGDISGKEYGSIEVMVTDFATSEAEFAVAYALMKQKDAEELEEHKKRPVPKL